MHLQLIIGNLLCYQNYYADADVIMIDSAKMKVFSSTGICNAQSRKIVYKHMHSCWLLYIYCILYLQQVQTKMQQEEEFDDIISQLSSNEGYLYVRHKPLAQQQYSAQRTLLVYSKTHTRTIQQLICIYAQEVNKQHLIDTIFFELELQNSLPGGMTLEEVRMKLRRANLDGLSLFAFEDNRTIVDEASLTECIQSELQYNPNAIEVSFALPNITYCLYLSIKGGNTYLKQIKEQLSTQIHRVFGIHVEAKSIVLSVTDVVTKAKRKAYIKDIQRILDEKGQVFVDFTESVTLKEPVFQSNNFIVIKDTAKAEFKSKTLPYDRIKHQKVIDILRNIEPRHNWEEYGLRIGDIALKPNDILEHRTKALFKNSTIHSKHIAALIVLEQHIFELETKKIAQKTELIDFNKVAFKNQSKHLIEVCDSVIRQRESVSSVASKNGKKMKMGTIYYYTTSLQVQSSDKKESKLYRIINEMLRKMQFCTVSPHEYEKWQYNYISHLYHDLQNIASYQDTRPLWRGLSKACQYLLHQTIVFKQFTSFSMEKAQALKFGRRTLFKVQKSSSGRPIKQFSHLQDEQEVLFLSYSRFKVVRLESDSDSTNVVVLEEVPRAIMPEMQVLMIFWIDDKPEIAKMYWQNFEQISKSIVMIQLLNNEQLQRWLESNQSIAEDKSVEIVLISNMKRRQNGVLQQKAGVQSAEIFRRHRPDDKILFFVGRTKIALQNLAQKGLHPSETLIITDDQLTLYGFLYEIAGLS